MYPGMGHSDADKDQSLQDQAEALLTLAHAQMADLQGALATLTGDDGLRDRLVAAASQMDGAIGTLSQALRGPSFALRRADLLALQGVVQSYQTTALLTQVAVQSGGSGRAEALGATSTALHAETRALAHDVFGRRIFDPYLRFTSAEDEEAFRKREAEARQYIEAQLARGTPEGNLNAGAGMAGYMLDAHAHGAGNSPDFMPRWNALVDKLERQRAAMRAAGQSTEECDHHLRANVRQYLKKMAGLSDTEIDARLDRMTSPLEAVTPFLGKDRASHKLEETALIIADTARTKPEDLPRVERMDAATAAAAALTIDPETMRARLKAAGILTDATPEQVSGHGLTAQKPVGRPRPGPAG